MLLMSGCHRGERAAESRPAASMAKPALPTIDLTPGEPSEAGRFGSDRLWRRARGGEPQHLAILAHHEGALGLLEGLQIGRSVGLTALAAIPYADDSELALTRLCAIAEQRASDPPVQLLESVHGIVARPPTQTEPLDNGGYIGCLGVMKKLEQRGLLKGSRYDLVESSIALIEEHRDAAKH